MAINEITEIRASLPYGPGHSAFDISPHDTNQIEQNGQPVTLRAVYVGGAGNITGKVMTEFGASATVTFTAVPAGTILNVAFTHIHTTSSATLMIGLL